MITTQTEEKLLLLLSFCYTGLLNPSFIVILLFFLSKRWKSIVRNDVVTLNYFAPNNFLMTFNNYNIMEFMVAI